MGVFQGASVGITLTANRSKWDPELRAARASVRQWEKDVERAGTRVRHAFGNAAKGVALIGAAGVAIAGKMGVDELNEAAKASAQTESALRSHGKQAYVTQRQVEALAGAITKKSGIDDQAVQNGQNLILTMGNLGGSVDAARRNFATATTVAADLSARMGNDVPGAARVLAKALAEPEKASGKLARIIGGLTAEQKAAIDMAVKQGDTAKAQALILEFVGKKVEGAAAAYGTTIPGQLGKAEEAFAGLAASAITKAVPAINGFIDSGERAIDNIRQWSQTADGRRTLDDLAAGATAAGNAIGAAGRTAVAGAGFLLDHRNALVAATAGYVGFRAAIAIGGAVNVANSAVSLLTKNVVAYTGATKGATAAQKFMALGMVVNPVTAVATGVGLLAAGLIGLKIKQDAATRAAEEAEQQLYDQARAAGSLYDANLQLRSASLGVKEANLAEQAAQRTVNQLRAQGKLHTIEGQQALAALERAQITTAEAGQRVAAAAATREKNRKDQIDATRHAVEKLNKIEAARAALRNAETARDNAVSGTDFQVLSGQVAKRQRELDAIVKGEADAIKQIGKVRRDGWGAVEQVDGQYVLREGSRHAKAQTERRRLQALGNQWVAREFAKLPGIVKPGVDGANEEMTRTGKLTPAQKAQLVRNVKAGFDGIGGQITRAIGKVTLNLGAILHLSGTGGSGGGLVGPLAGVDALTPLANRSGLVETSGYRPGDKGFHGQNRARDYGGSASAMRGFAQLLAAVYGPNLLELIHTPLGYGIKNGKRVPASFFGADVAADHYDHVHVAAQRGLGLVPGTGTGDIVPAMLEPGEGIINRNAMRALGGRQAIEAINQRWPRFQTGGYVDQARRAAAIAADPQRTLDDIIARTVAATTAMNKRIDFRNAAANRKDTKEVARLNALIVADREALKDLATQQVSAEAAVAQAREAMRADLAAAAQADADEAARRNQEAADAAARAAQSAADEATRLAEEAKEAARRQRDAELDRPRAVLTLADAMRDLERSQAEATATLDDDIATRQRSLQDEERRRSELATVLARVDLSDDERAKAIQDFAASNRATISLTKDIADLTATANTDKAGASLDDLLAEMRLATQALFAMGAREAGNVFQIAEIKQTFAQQTGLTGWQLLTQAQVQGSV